MPVLPTRKVAPVSFPHLFRPGRIGNVDDVARALVQLAGPDFGYATGIDLKLDGGLCDRVLGAVPGLPANRPPAGAGGSSA